MLFIKKLFTPPPSPRVDEKINAYLADSYPGNHNYRVVGDTLRPCFKLARRWRRIERLWPHEFDSFLDIGCAKGFFVLQAARRGADSLGIDISDDYIDACNIVRDELGIERARFANQTIDQLCADGESFDLVQVVNTYHYLYFGSGGTEPCAADHAVLFEHLAAVTKGVLLFSNVEKFERCPGMAKRRATPGTAERYTPEAIRTAAARWFDIEDHGNLGSRPVWIGRRKNQNYTVK